MAEPVYRECNVYIARQTFTYFWLWWNLIHYKMPLWDKALLDKLIVSQLVKMLPFVDRET
jgi:hypothetical protein